MGKIANIITSHQSRCWWWFQDCDIRNQLNLDYSVVKARCKFNQAELRTARRTYPTFWWHVSK